MWGRDFQFLPAFGQSDSNQFGLDETRSGTKGMDGPAGRRPGRLFLVPFSHLH